MKRRTLAVGSTSMMKEYVPSSGNKQLRVLGEAYFFIKFEMIRARGVRGLESAGGRQKRKKSFSGS
jgi:hypothetical protein